MHTVNPYAQPKQTDLPGRDAAEYIADHERGQSSSRSALAFCLGSMLGLQAGHAFFFGIDNAFAYPIVQPFEAFTLFLLVAVTGLLLTQPWSMLLKRFTNYRPTGSHRFAEGMFLSSAWVMLLVAYNESLAIRGAVRGVFGDAGGWIAMLTALGFASIVASGMGFLFARTVNVMGTHLRRTNR